MESRQQNRIRRKDKKYRRKNKEAEENGVSEGKRKSLFHWP